MGSDSPNAPGTHRSMGPQKTDGTLNARGRRLMERMDDLRLVQVDSLEPLLATAYFADIDHALARADVLCAALFSAPGDRREVARNLRQAARLQGLAAELADVSRV